MLFNTTFFDKNNLVCYYMLHQKGEKSMNIFEKIPYNVYTKAFKVNRIITLSSLALLTANYFTVNDPMIASALSTTVDISGILLIYNSLVDNESKTKEIVYIKKLYDEFIKEYNKLNKIFDFRDPNEVFAMFSYLLHKGFLSKDEIFIHDDSNTFDGIYTLLGVNIMTGNAVCRHNASLLSDIYTDLGQKSLKVPIFSSNELNIFYDQFKRDTDIQALEKFTMSLENGKTIYDTMRELIYDKSYLLEELENIGYSNHLITQVTYNDKAYFFDPTNEIISKRFGDCLIGNDGSIYVMNRNRLKRYNPRNIKNEVIPNFILPNTPFEDDIELITKTKKICENNQDIFQKFYNEHHELYEEVDYTINTLTKKKVKKMAK